MAQRKPVARVKMMGVEIFRIFAGHFPGRYGKRLASIQNALSGDEYRITLRSLRKRILPDKAPTGNIWDACHISLPEYPCFRHIPFLVALPRLFPGKTVSFSPHLETLWIFVYIGLRLYPNRHNEEWIVQFLRIFSRC
jgi:hypothetical protein